MCAGTLSVLGAAMLHLTGHVLGKWQGIVFVLMMYVYMYECIQTSIIQVLFAFSITVDARRIFLLQLRWTCPERQACSLGKE